MKDGKNSPKRFWLQAISDELKTPYRTNLIKKKAN